MAAVKRLKADHAESNPAKCMYTVTAPNPSHKHPTTGSQTGEQSLENESDSGKTGETALINHNNSVTAVCDLIFKNLVHPGALG